MGKDNYNRKRRSGIPFNFGLVPFSSHLHALTIFDAVMVTESAIALLEPSELPTFAREGGVLTPVTGLGDAIVKRLEQSGRYKFETEVLDSEETRKPR